MEAFKTNVVGTDNLLEAGIQNKVQKIVCLSTDKAVYPINAMGVSKAMMEKVALSKARKIQNAGPIICCTRYGNVMASRGSVIPLFVEQILQGIPLSITDPNMTRFMMTLLKQWNWSCMLSKMARMEIYSSKGTERITKYINRCA